MFICLAAAMCPSAEENDCMKCLYTSNYTSFMTRTPKWEPETCNWFLAHKSYLDWRQEKKSSLLWVSADPGCGKSVLARFLVHQLKSERNQLTLPGTVCHFFFKDDNEKQRSALSALCALLHQFFMSKSAMIKHAVEEYRPKGQKIFEELNTLWKILVTASTAPSSENIICIVDGLDECEEPARTELMDLITGFYKGDTASHTDGAFLKMIITSRPYSSIERNFRSLPTIRLKVEDETEALSADIELVVQARIDSLGTLWDLRDEVRNRLKDRLIMSADRTFLWVSLVLDNLRSTPKPSESEFEHILRTLPQDLDATYKKIIQRSSDPEVGRRILHVVIAATRPLTLQEVNVAQAVRPGYRSLEDLDIHLVFNAEATLKNYCGLFLRVINRKVYLVHQTAKEFLIRDSTNDNVHSEAWKHSFHLVESNRVLAEICVSYLSFEVFESHPLVLKEDPASTESEERTNRYVAEHDFLDYAAKNWVFHFRAAEIRDGNALMKPTLDLCDPGLKRGSTWLSVSWTAERLPCSDPTLLMITSGLGLEVIVRHLLGAGANAQLEDKWRALHEAAQYGHETVVSMLLEAGANIEAQDDDGWTALLLAAQYSRETVLSTLVKAGANIHAQHESGRTALHVAAEYGDNTTLSALLDAGADIQAQTKDGQTALHMAASEGYEDTVRLLIKHGADINVRDESWHTPLELAAKNESEKVYEFLLKQGADFNSESVEDGFLLVMAASLGQADIVRLLLDNGIDINATNEAGYTALYKAADNEKEKMVELLLEKGAEVNVQDECGLTPLHFAAEHGLEHMALLLLQYEANVYAEDYFGYTPLQKAERRGHKRIVQILEAHMKGKSSTVPWI